MSTLALEPYCSCSGTGWPVDLTIELEVTGFFVDCSCVEKEEEEEEDGALAMFCTTVEETTQVLSSRKRAAVHAICFKIFALKLHMLASQYSQYSPPILSVLCSALVKQAENGKRDGFSAEEGEGHRTGRCLLLLVRLDRGTNRGSANLHWEGLQAQGGGRT